MKSKISALSLSLAMTIAPAVYAVEPGYVAHEWGTFTSVQGSDGVQLQWRAALVSELPGFVHSSARSTPASTFAIVKGDVMGLQRMETPVIYFYNSGSQPLKVKATVDFPLGLITEWYPRPAEIGPFAVSNAVYRKQSGIVWNVDLEGAANRQFETKLPMDKSGSHYFAARETDSTMLRAGAESKMPEAEFEKFLFYRGIGFSPAPLQVRIAADGTVALTNAGPEALTHLFVLKVKAGQGTFAYQDSLKGSERDLISAGAFKPLTSLAELKKDLIREMAGALEKEGLYPREAAAMVNTWKDSWFAEEGTRVLYVLPRGWTDATLPLQLDPAPGSLVRVMVGRAEIIAPEVEQGLREELVKATKGNPAAREAVSRQLARLGRFASPAVQIAAKGLDQNVVTYAVNAASIVETSPAH